MSFRGPVILLFVLAAISAYIYFDEIEPSREKEKQKSAASKFTANLSANKISRIQLNDIEMEKQDGTWRIRKPVEDLANAAEVQRLVDLIVGAQSEKVAKQGGVDWKVFGLHQPAGQITVWQSEDSTQFYISARKNYKGKSYLRVGEEERVLLVDSSWLKTAQKKVEEFRDKNIFRGDPKTIERIALKKNGKKVVEFDLQGGFWKTDSILPIDVKTVEQWLTSLHTIRAHKFMSDRGEEPAELEKYELHKPEYEVVFDIKGTKWSMLVSKKVNNQRYVKVSDRPTVYWTNHLSFNDAIKKRPRDFWHKGAPFAIDKEKVIRVEFRVNGKKTVFEKPVKGWGADKQTFLNSVSQLRVNEFPQKSVNTMGDKPSRMDLVIDGSPNFFLEWQEKGEKTVNVRSSLYSRVTPVAKSLFEKLELQKVLESSGAP